MLTHFIVSDDVERSRRFCTEVLGGETVRAGGAIVRSRLGAEQRRRPPRAPPIRWLVSITDGPCTSALAILGIRKRAGVFQADLLLAS